MRYRVTYSVTYTCDVEVDRLPSQRARDEELEDAISDIDIPEGGKNNSVYKANTFEVTDISCESVD